MVGICCAFWFLIFGHRLVLYNITDGSCGAFAGVYSDIDNYLEVVFTGILPPIVMTVCAYLLIRSVRDVINRRAATENPTATGGHRTVLQQMDSQLTLMLILQSIIAMVTYFPYATQLIYSNVTEFYHKSDLQLAQEKVMIEFIHILSYVFFASSFYVSMISNIGYRRQFKKIYHIQQKKNAVGTLQTVEATVMPTK
jgi:phosphate/sulfate permease